MTLLRKPAHRIVLCRGEFCNLGRRSDKLIPRLQAAVDAVNATRPDGPPCVGFRTANCLSMCGKGPNLVVYPEDDVYNALDAERLEEVIARYVTCPPDDAAGDG